MARFFFCVVECCFCRKHGAERGVFVVSLWCIRGKNVVFK